MHTLKTKAYLRAYLRLLNIAVLINEISLVVLYHTLISFISLTAFFLALFDIVCNCLLTDC